MRPLDLSLARQAVSGQLFVALTDRSLILAEEGGIMAMGQSCLIPQLLIPTEIDAS
jgi:hypothetical protein